MSVAGGVPLNIAGSEVEAVAAATDEKRCRYQIPVAGDLFCDAGFTDVKQPFTSKLVQADVEASSAARGNIVDEPREAAAKRSTACNTFRVAGESAEPDERHGARPVPYSLLPRTDGAAPGEPRVFSRSPSPPSTAGDADSGGGEVHRTSSHRGAGPSPSQRGQADSANRHTPFCFFVA